MKTTKKVIVYLMVFLLVFSVQVFTVEPLFSHNIQNVKYNTTTMANLIGRTGVVLSPGVDASVNVTRSISFSEYLFVTLNDTIEIVNKEDKPFDVIEVFYSKELFSKIKDLHIVCYSTKNRLNYEQFITTQHYVGLRIYLDHSVTKDQKYTLYIRGYLDDVINTEFSEYGQVYFNLTLPDYKFHINHNITQYNLYVYYGSDADLTPYINNIKPEGGNHNTAEGRYEWTFTNVDAFNYSDVPQPLSVPFNKNIPPTKILELTRTIYFRTSMTIHIEDTFVLAVYYPGEVDIVKEARMKLSSIEYDIYEGVTNVKAYDDFGELNVDYSKRLSGARENWTYVVINFRTELTGNKVYSFRVTYDIALNNSNVLVENESGIYFNFPIAPVINISIIAFRLSIVTPYVIAIKNIEYLSDFNETRYLKTSALGLYVYEVINYGKGNFVPFDNVILQYRIYTSPMPFFWILLGFFGIFLLIVIALSLLFEKLGEVARKPKIEEIHEVREIAEELKKYIRQLEEYIVAEEGLYDFMYAKVIQKPTTRNLELLREKLRRLRGMENRIKKVPTTLSAIPEIRAIIDKILDAQTNVEIARSRIIRNIQNFLKGSMSKKEMYNENELYLRNINKTTNIIRKHINRLKDLLITKYSG